MAVSSTSLIFTPRSVIRPPYPSTARRLGAGAVSGIAICAVIPRIRAARATACAWFPEDIVTTPRAASSSLRERIAFEAPRNLNAPIFWKFSHLKKSEAPVLWSKVLHVRTGVRWTPLRRIRSDAARTSARVGLPDAAMLLLRALAHLPELIDDF